MKEIIQFRGFYFHAYKSDNSNMNRINAYYTIGEGFHISIIPKDILNYGSFYKFKDFRFIVRYHCNEFIYFL